MAETYRNILERMAASSRRRAAEAEARFPFADLRASVEAADAPEPFRFEKALSGEGLSFICECKKASPSKGLIEPDYRPVETACAYEAAGAAAVSVLTEPKAFLGTLEDLQAVALQVAIPVLRKDFVVSPYQIVEARAYGAEAVLLICALLDEKTLESYLRLCDELGMSALVEAHDLRETRMARAAGARVIGVNNRNLKDFTVDFQNSIRLRASVPDGTVFVAESGVRTAQDVALLRDAGIDAVLVGETLMRAEDKGALLEELRGGGERS